MDDEEDLGSFDLALQRIISFINIGDYEAADKVFQQQQLQQQYTQRVNC
jgi:hypothetical protein